MNEINDAHLHTVDSVAEALQVSRLTGLTSDEAARRLELAGYNELPEEPPTPVWRLILNAFEDRMVQILLAAAVVSFFMAVASGDVHDLVEPFVIVTILVLNAIVGVWQESSAEAAIKALKSFAPTKATVLRNSTITTIPARELVPGDVVEVAVGSRVPADLRVTALLSTTVRVDQSILTGESVEVMKHTDVVTSEECFAVNMLYSGTNISYGKAVGIVVKTGPKTQIGTIEGAVRSAQEEKTPLQEKLDEFGELLSKVIGIICLLVFAVNVLRFIVFSKDHSGGYVAPLVHSLKLAISLAVAAIPEGLPAVVTTCLALGTRRMAHQNALVRSLPSVETLGCCTVICSDKTGTLTTNMMSVSTVITVGKDEKLRQYRVEDSRFNYAENSVSRDGVTVANPVQEDFALAHVSSVCCLCNDASLAYNSKTAQTERVGEATEAALLVLAEKMGFAFPPATHPSTPEERVCAVSNLWKSQYKKEATLEFTRERKSMSVCCSTSTQKYLFVKGAPEAILERSTKVMLSDMSERPLSNEMRARLAEALKKMSCGSQALRCIACAYRKIDDATLGNNLSDPNRFASLESGLTFCGMVGMLDPPRQEVRGAIEQCYTAGIRVIVITGDNKDTAESICRRIGVFTESESLVGRSFTGAEFAKLTPSEQLEAMKTAQLFSRTDPSLKSHLVSLLQQHKLVCAMTGDGVNDAPALKKADIGVAMGSGTEVAKAASKMILADDNFNTIVKAIGEGRAIYNNTKQFIRYLISSNIGEVVCIFTTGLLGLPDALEPVQLLWVNLVTDGLPATALGFNPPDPDIMEKPPRKSSEPIINGWLFTRYLLVGIYVGIATIGGFIWWFLANGYTFGEIMNADLCNDGSARCTVLHDPREARAVALSVLVVVEMFNALNAVSENESVLSFPPYKNKWLLAAVVSSMFLHFVVLYVPFMCYIFNVAPLGVPGVDARTIGNSTEWLLVPTEFKEWKAIIVLSFPVMLLDEVLKYVTRRATAGKKQ
eukprot:PhM_4_TR10996/c0_g1_i1/m.29159/K05853/ATP2A; Ca2+ transporting ATPase, sarcoplasmic/endoplasmic reticulum